MKVLVTGASGMLGATLCNQLLADGLEVRALVRRPIDHPLLVGKPIEEARGDLRDIESLEKAVEDCGQVYHLAGKVSYDDRDRELLFDTNVTGTINVLRSAATRKVSRVVVTSSTAAVGFNQPGQRPLDESAVFHSRYRHVPYMNSKYMAEKFAMSFRDVEVVVTNPATIYGAGDVYLNTGQLVRKIQQGNVRFYPPGGTAVVSVTDCASGQRMAMQSGKPGQRYILATANHSYRDIFCTIADCLHVKRPTTRLHRLASFPAKTLGRIVDATTGWTRKVPTLRHLAEMAFVERYFDAGKAIKELGWSPTQDLVSMIREAVEFYNSLPDNSDDLTIEADDG